MEAITENSSCPIAKTLKKQNNQIPEFLKELVAVGCVAVKLSIFLRDCLWRRTLRILLEGVGDLRQRLNQITAIQSISTNTSFGKRETSTQARAGAVSASKYLA